MVGLQCIVFARHCVGALFAIHAIYQMGLGAMTKDDSSDGPGTIPTNLRLLVLLEQVAKAGIPVTPSSVNEVLGLPKPTIHRLFATAEAEGFLQRDLDGRSYSLGLRMQRMATDTLTSERVKTVRLAVLTALATKVGETCNLSIPDKEGMIYLDRVETQWPLRIQLPIGTQVPLHCTASGKMFLSTLRRDYLDRLLRNYPLVSHTDQTITDTTAMDQALAEIRRQGYAVDNEEFMQGMTAIAVPVMTQRGRMLGTLSVHAPEQRRSVTALLAMLDDLRAAADEMAALV